MAGVNIGSKVCAVVAAEDTAEMWRQLRRALEGAQTIELRLDWLANDKEIERFLTQFARKASQGPSRKVRRGPAKLGTTMFIATCRRREAGGRYRGTIAKQLFYLADALRAGCEWYDLEIESASRCPSELIDVLLGAGKQICSAHFFRHAPRTFSSVAAELRRMRPEAIKIAAQCESLAEAERLLAICRRRQDVIAVPMGDIALPMRILAPRESSALAYSPIAHSTARGQVTWDEMRWLYGADQISNRTWIYGVIGDPIAHSLSPQLHNAGFQARQIDAVYLPFLVRDLRDFVGVIESIGVKGFSVTLPHKQAILSYLGECDELAKSIGAVNTVTVRANGKLCGSNSDYVGVLRALERRMPLRGSRVLIFGAGGVARAIAFALARGGASVWVCARRMTQATALARAAGGEAIERRLLRGEFFDAIVNATPVGMDPDVHRSPLKARELNCRMVFDTIYRPRVTKLMQLAARRGIETVSGIEMFIAQGTAQWEIWRGQRAPEKAMRAAVLAALAKEEKQTHRRRAG